MFYFKISLLLQIVCLITNCCVDPIITIQIYIIDGWMDEQTRTDRRTDRMRNKQTCNVNHSLTYRMFKLLVVEAAEQASRDQR